MKLILENIGMIKKAEIDLDHQLTVFFGPNNTGKTYVSYCLYGVNRINAFGEEAENVSALIDIDFVELYQKQSTIVNLKESLLPKREIVKAAYIQGFRISLPRLFGNYEIDFSKATVELSFFDNDIDFKKIIEQGTSFKGRRIRYSNTKAFVVQETIAGEVEIRLSSEFDPNFVNEGEKKTIERLLQTWIIRNVFNLGFEVGSFIPAERIGVSVFGKDILQKRFEASNSPIKNDEFSPYSLVIEAAILEQDSWSGKRPPDNNRGIYSSIAFEIEKEILGGNLSLNEAGDVFYGNEQVEALSIRNSASAIKSLVALVFYLRYYAHHGGTLFIDEPEINLYPDNQIKIARILAKIANLGIKVYVSTHSDYIIREFNNLIMLGKDDPEKERLMKEYGYKEDEVLNRDNIGAYFFRKDGMVESVDVTETGLEMKGIDDTINSQNKASNDIMWTLFDQ